MEKKGGNAVKGDNDLISRSALMQYMKDYRWEFVHREDFPKAVEMVDCAPIVDAVEVVRCKDCKHWKHFDHLGCTDFVKVCGLANYMIGANGYCLYGERRADDD